MAAAQASVLELIRRARRRATSRCSASATPARRSWPRRSAGRSSPHPSPSGVGTGSSSQVPAEISRRARGCSGTISASPCRPVLDEAAPLAPGPAGVRPRAAPRRAVSPGGRRSRSSRAGPAWTANHLARAGASSTERPWPPTKCGYAASAREGGLHPVRRLPAASPPCREERAVNTTSLDEVIPGGLAAGGARRRSPRSACCTPTCTVSRGARMCRRPSSGTWIDHGLCFCAAVMGTDLRHTPVVGGELGPPGSVAMPDLDTMVPTALGAGVWPAAWPTFESSAGGPAPADPRGTLRRAVAACTRSGL